MTQDLYTQLKAIFDTFQFTTEANFYTLYKHAKQMGLRGLSFHKFTNHAKQMGVLSSVRRVDSGVERVLSYDIKADKYRKMVFPQLEVCPHCQGSGLIDILKKS